MNQAEKAKAFGALHRKGNPVVLYNIWDAGTAKAVTDAGAKALATGSWSVAAAQGYGDGEKIPLEALVAVTRQITAVNDLPLSVDFEGAYSTEPAGAAANVAKLIDAGAVGINFEDRVVGGSGLHRSKSRQPASAPSATHGRRKGHRLLHQCPHRSLSRRERPVEACRSGR
jgi:2-methylisocitrate lyase-like PEP mutase family enzyme